MPAATTAGNPAANPPAKPPEKPPAQQSPKAPKTTETLITPEPKIEEVREIIEDDTDQDTDVINEQILRTPRKSIGLRPQADTIEVEPVEVVSNRAQEIIDESKERAKTDTKAISNPSKPIVISKPPAKPKPRPRRRSSSFQPANRAKRLDRSRHMEYKYEMRGLLQELNIPEEHCSNILGTIWARGERQTVSDAKEFISEKCEQGILNEDQGTTLRGVVDRYTVRR